jgi:hypothetical protein
MSPLRYRVVTDDGTDTRDPANDELRNIEAYVGRYVAERAVEPMGDHEVPGVAPLVLFQVIHN